MRALFCAVGVVFLVACAAPAPGTGDQTDQGSLAEGHGGEAEVMEIPPVDAIPLSEIIASIEVPNHIHVVEAEFEDGVWEIEYVMAGEEHELQIDPMTGESLP